MKPLVPIVAAALLLAGCGGSEQEGAVTNQGSAAAPAKAGAQSANAAESIRTRQTHYKQIGGATKGINDELKKDSPDVAKIQAHAATINGFAPQIAGWFPDGTGAAAGVKTDARDEIWSNPAEFKRQSDNFVRAAAQFHQTAQGGDMEAIRAGVKPLGESCKGCHELFRAEN